MRILFIHCAYQYKGGEDILVEQEAALLRAKGMTVEVMHFTNKNKVVQNLLQLPFNRGAYLKVKAAAAAYRPHIVHIHNLHFAASPSVLYALRKAGVPFVITLHNMRLLCPSAMLFHKGNLFLHSLKHGFPWQAVKAGVYKGSRLLTLWLGLSMQLHKWLHTWQLADRYIALTDHAKGLFLSSGLGLTDEQIVVKPNFTACAKTPAFIASDYYLFIGRLSGEKGIRVLLEAFSSAPYKLKIAGDGPLKEEVEACSKKGANIEYMGALQKEEINSLLSKCKALIFPSIWYEGMPLTIIEAFACGAPVIASDIGAMQTMITPHYNGLHFKAGCSTDLLARLNEWESMEFGERHEYRLHAFKTYQQKYTPEKNIDQLLHIYNSVLEERARAERTAIKILSAPAIDYTKQTAEAEP